METISEYTQKEQNIFPAFYESNKTPPSKNKNDENSTGEQTGKKKVNLAPQYKSMDRTTKAEYLLRMARD